MGYVTEYRLKIAYDEGVDPVTTSEIVLDQIMKDPKIKSIDLQPGKLPYELGYCVGHWYDYEKDIQAIARCFPGCTFTLHGKGEESDDEWETEFKGNSSRYRAVAIRWSDWRGGFEGKFEPAYYTLYLDLPKHGKLGETCMKIVEWMRQDSADWAHVFDLNIERPVKCFESNGAVEWFGYAQMQDLAKAFPDCAFELRCVPVRKGSEYIYRIAEGKEQFKQTELSWIDWSTWR